MTTNDLDQAREWARDPSYQGDFPSVAAARVIASLPDEWIDADELRDVINSQLSSYPHGTVGHHVAEEIACELEALFPSPQPRTLKDMTPEEREACQWSMVETPNDEGVFIKQSGNDALVIYPSGRHIFWDLDLVVPMLDMPRMVWPDEQATAHYDEGMAPEVEEGTYGKPFWDMITKAIRDEKEYHIDAQDYEGVKRWRDAERALHTAMETNPPKESPVPTRPEDVPEGEVWIVECYGDRHVGTRDPNAAPNWALARMDGLDTTFAGDELVDLVTRLVPEVKA